MSHVNTIERPPYLVPGQFVGGPQELVLAETPSGPAWAICKPIDLSSTHGVVIDLEALETMARDYDPERIEAAAINIDHLPRGPAHGWIQDLFVSDGMLWARPVDLSEELAQGIAKRRYRRQSIEATTCHPSTGRWYCNGLAILGARRASVKSLPAIHLAERTRRVFYVGGDAGRPPAKPTPATPAPSREQLALEEAQAATARDIGRVAYALDPSGHDGREAIQFVHEAINGGPAPRTKEPTMPTTDPITLLTAGDLDTARRQGLTDDDLRRVYSKPWRLRELELRAAEREGRPLPLDPDSPYAPGRETDPLQLLTAAELEGARRLGLSDDKIRRVSQKPHRLRQLQVAADERNGGREPQTPAFGGFAGRAAADLDSVIGRFASIEADVTKRLTDLQAKALELAASEPETARLYLEESKKAAELLSLCQSQRQAAERNRARLALAAPATAATSPPGPPVPPPGDDPIQLLAADTLAESRRQGMTDDDIRRVYSQPHRLERLKEEAARRAEGTRR